VTLSALIIDDSPFARKIIRHHLIKFGFHVVGEAENAAQGLRLFRELKPRLVTLDVMMPERESTTSLAAFRTIRSEAPETVVVVVSAAVREDTRYVFERRRNGLRDQAVQPVFLRASAAKAAANLSGGGHVTNRSLRRLRA
jgi:DNA-binding NarL/FixJ family response regulator